VAGKIENHTDLQVYQKESVAEFAIGRGVDQVGVALWRRLSCAGGDLHCIEVAKLRLFNNRSAS